ncbi:hypothetical protein VB714_04780 [Spirulina sp. 06S082]|nr:hypothetical protein [Spirulina sp. 06S082]MEA5468175.1 hypothetical protein [Spirulina sp. 06S082]
MSYRMDRRAYAETYGPTTGDRVRFVGQLLILWVVLRSEFWLAV